MLNMDTLSFRPSKKARSDFEALLRQGVLSKSELVRSLFELGLSEWKKTEALRRLSEGRLSFLSAAQFAGLSAWEFAALIEQRKTSWIHLSESDLESDLKTLR
jgi:predicted HTH domain antitoxin